LLDKVEGVSNSVVVAALLPLIENAMEASAEGAPIVVSCELTSAGVELHVRGRPSSLPVDAMYSSGFTTKKNHEGLGLSAVQRLLRAYPGSTLQHVVEGNDVTFTISLVTRSAR
jgi:sensor histidine kinase regulating citrate/malate metabolism